MIIPIQAATVGLIKDKTSLTIASRGLLHIIPIDEDVLEYHGGGMRGDAWDLPSRDQMWHDMTREDNEILEIIIGSILSGVI